MASPLVHFEWDPAKADANLANHGVDFVTAAACFEHELLQWIDDREDYGEVRVIALGRADADVFRVVYTQRRPDSIRIISAQKASKRERESYYREVFRQ